jgi:hypothetical protein
MSSAPVLGNLMAQGCSTAIVLCRFGGIGGHPKSHFFAQCYEVGAVRMSEIGSPFGQCSRGGTVLLHPIPVNE